VRRERDLRAHAHDPCARDTRQIVLPTSSADEQRTLRVYAHAHRSPHRIAVLVDESGQHVDRLTRRHAVRERDEDDRQQRCEQ